MAPQNTKGNAPMIFISYRRSESTGHAGRLAADLSAHYGQSNVFRDIDSLEPGLNFVEALNRAVDRCDVLIAVIGRGWHTETDESGQVRLQNPNDFHRMEIATGLKRNIRVIPVLVAGASMPRPEELPEDVAPLSTHNAFELHDTSWNGDVERLTSALDRVFGFERDKQPTMPPQQSPQHPQQSPQGSRTSAGRFARVLIWIFAIIGILVVLGMCSAILNA